MNGKKEEVDIPHAPPLLDNAKHNERLGTPEIHKKYYKGT